MAFMSILADPFKLGSYVKIFDPDDSQYPAIVFDATPTINPQHEAEITEYPVETGGKISDNIDLKPTVLSFDAIITNHPIGLEQAFVGNAAGLVGGALTSTLGGISGTVATGVISAIGSNLLGTSNDRARDHYQKIMDLFNKKKPLTVQTKMDQYANMVITSLSVPRDSTTGESIRFSISFREIRFAVPKTSRYKPKPAVEHTAAKQSELGKQSGTQVESETEEKASLIYKTTRWIKS